jgi:hypothetical protein
MSIAYAVEKFTAVRPEIEPHVDAHWNEFASNKGDAAMDVDWALYESLCRSGKLHVFTARRDGRLVGYFGCILSTHPHRRTVLTASSSFLYVAQDPIRGLIIRGLIAISINCFNTMGVKLYHYRSKNSHNIGQILEKMGFNTIETVYSMASEQP